MNEELYKAIEALAKTVKDSRQARKNRDEALQACKVCRRDGAKCMDCGRTNYCGLSKELVKAKREVNRLEAYFRLGAEKIVEIYLNEHKEDEV